MLINYKSRFPSGPAAAQLDTEELLSKIKAARGMWEVKISIAELAAILETLHRNEINNENLEERIILYESTLRNQT